MGELRRVTVLFINLPETQHTTLEERQNSLVQLQTTIEVVQQSLKHYEGGIRQYIVDDKGTVLIAVFGLPSLSHEGKEKIQ